MLLSQLGGSSTESLRLDELANALESLETCGYFIETLPEPFRWKWAIIALHQAIYGFAICAVRGTDSRSVLQPHKKDGSQDLIPVWGALRRAEDRRLIWATATPLGLTADERWALERLFGEFRDGFVHFQPAGWSIQVVAMVEVFAVGVAVLRRLAVGNGLVLFVDELDGARAQAAIARLEALLTLQSSG